MFSDISCVNGRFRKNRVLRHSRVVSRGCIRQNNTFVIDLEDELAMGDFGPIIEGCAGLKNGWKVVLS